jgi:hypothetical protein
MVRLFKAQKQPNVHDFLTNISSKSKSWNEKIKNKNKNATRFYCKEGTKFEYGYDIKKKPPKTGVKQIESNRKLYPYSYLLGT